MANTILRKGKLILDISGEYWYQDPTSGLYFRLRMLLRQDYGDEAEYNAAVDEMNTALKKVQPSGNEYFCTLGCVPAAVANLVNSGWDKTLQPKTRLFLWDSGFQGGVGEALPKYGVFEPDFIWVNNDIVYTPWDENNLAHRYYRTAQAPNPAAIQPGGGSDNSSSGNSGNQNNTGTVTLTNSKIALDLEIANSILGSEADVPVTISGTIKITPIEGEEQEL